MWLLRLILQDQLDESKLHTALRCVETRGDGELSLPEFIMLMVCYDTQEAGAWGSDLYAAFRALAQPYKPIPTEKTSIDVVTIKDLKKYVGGDNKQFLDDFTEVLREAFPTKTDDDHLDLTEFLGFFLPPPS